jgi:hypothetical protein
VAICGFTDLDRLVLINEATALGRDDYAKALGDGHWEGVPTLTIGADGQRAQREGNNLRPSRHGKRSLQDSGSQAELGNQGNPGLRPPNQTSSLFSDSIAGRTSAGLPYDSPLPFQSPSRTVDPLAMCTLGSRRMSGAVQRMSVPERVTPRPRVMLWVEQ